MKTKYTMPLIASLTVLATALIFCAGLPYGKEAIDYVALLFILIAEGAFFGVLFMTGKANGLTSLAVVPIISIYAVISIIVSVLLKGFFRGNILTFIVIQLVLLAVVVIVLLIANKLTLTANEDDKKIAIQRAVIDECETKAKILCEDIRFSQCGSILTRIYEGIKFSDHISDVKSGEILDVLSSIYELEDGSDAMPLCEKAMKLINERNIIVKSMKRGGY